jgi:hypothetical protein
VAIRETVASRTSVAVAAIAVSRRDVELKETLI